MDSTLEQAVQSSRRYWYVDGLAEISIGVFFFLLGGIFFLLEKASFNSRIAVLIALGMPVLIIFGSRLLSRVVNMSKLHSTYPRTGYLAYRQLSRKRRWIILTLTAV